MFKHNPNPTKPMGNVRVTNANGGRLEASHAAARQRQSFPPSDPRSLPTVYNPHIPPGVYRQGKDGGLFDYAGKKVWPAA